MAWLRMHPTPRSKSRTPHRPSIAGRAQNRILHAPAASLTILRKHRSGLACDTDSDSAGRGDALTVGSRRGGAPGPGAIESWIDANFREGAQGSPQDEFRMLLRMHLYHGLSTADGVALAVNSIRRRHPTFTPQPPSAQEQH